MDENVAVVMGIFRAVEERDGEALLALYHDEIEFHDAESLPYGGVFRGKRQARERLESGTEETWLGTWGPFQPTPAERRMDPRIVSSNDGEVVVAYHLRAVSATGERIDHPVVAIYQVRDGKFARAQMFYYDTVALAGFLERAKRAPSSEDQADLTNPRTKDVGTETKHMQRRRSIDESAE